MGQSDIKSVVKRMERKTAWQWLRLRLEEAVHQGISQRTNLWRSWRAPQLRCEMMTLSWNLWKCGTDETPAWSVVVVVVVVASRLGNRTQGNLRRKPVELHLPALRIKLHRSRSFPVSPFSFQTPVSLSFLSVLFPFPLISFSILFAPILA